MDEIHYAYLTAGVIVAYFLANVVTRRFDPFAPTWLFLVGYVQIYVIQAIHYHDWGVEVRGKELVAAADWRALWALLWFLLVYHVGPGRRLSAMLPRPPRAWSPGVVASLAPPLVLWGLVCAGIAIRSESHPAGAADEGSIFGNFPFVMLVAAILLIATGRNMQAPRPAFLAAGLAVSSAYVMIWMFNGKRSHSLIGVLTTVCALYLTWLKRPSWPVLLSTAFAGSLVVAIAIGWRNDREHPRSFGGFASFLADFQVSRILQSLNVADTDDEIPTYETEEYGGFLLMMDTVPEKSDYDYGANYLRVFSTFIPRVLWPSKPVYGRTAWINAWIAGSELEREDDFTGPAIGLLGATQLNGGATATAIVVACIALVLRSAYEFLRLHADVPWVQFWWTITYYNAWFMVVCDGPLVWFYLNWGFTTFPIVVLMWWVNRFRAPGTGDLATAPRAAIGVT
jgi:hypothetical protein